MIKKEFDLKELEEEDDACAHLYITKEHGFEICKDCGLEVKRILNYEQDWGRCMNNKGSHYLRKSDDSSAYQELDNYGISEEIIQKVNDLYSNVTSKSVYRGQYKKAIVFGCLYYVYKNTDGVSTIKNIFNLDKKTILKGIKFINLNMPKNSDIKTKYITDKEMINDYVDKLKLKENTEEICELYYSIKNKSSIINRSRLQSVISSLIYYYLTKKKYKTITIKEYSNKISLSSITIQKIIKEIDKILK